MLGLICICEKQYLAHYTDVQMLLQTEVSASEYWIQKFHSF